jgi:FkbM family methyltransferase
VKSSSGAHTLEDLRNCVKTIKIATLRVDTLLRILNVKNIDIVKIDMEDHENKVISGMDKLLNRNPPRVLVIETQRSNLSLR